MLSLNAVKNVLFSGERQKESLLKAVRAVSGFNQVKDFDEALHALFFRMNEDDLQYTLAPFLRSAAIQHVKTGQSSEYFRMQYCKTHGQPALDNY